MACAGPPDTLAASLSRKAWNRYSAGGGAKGRREYDWAWIAVIPPADEATAHHWLLIRRRIRDGELAFLPLLGAHPRRSAAPGLLPLTVIEIRHLFAKLITTTSRPASFYEAWSRWRRIHQARARGQPRPHPPRHRPSIDIYITTAER